MTPAEVVGASNRDAWDQYGEGYATCRHLVQSTHEAGRHRFDVRFCFDADDKLVIVSLRPIGVDDVQRARLVFSYLKDQLTATYGQSHSGLGMDDLARGLGIGGEKMWRDVSGGNEVKLRRVTDLVTLEYRPLKSGL